MIQLTKDLWMDADANCYTVGKLRQRVGRDAALVDLTYYSTAAQAVQGALKRAMRQGVADGSITTLREFIREQKKLWAELETLIAPLGGGTALQKAVEARPGLQMGNYIPQDQDTEKEAQA